MKRTLLLILSGLFIACYGNSFAEENQPVTEFVYDDHGKRDPLWPLVSNLGTVINYETDFIISDLALEGTMFDTDGSGLAIVNGKIVKVNDQIGQFTVLKIDKESIILSKGDQTFELKLKKGE